MLLGAHLSTQGGLHKALDKAGVLGFSTVALFVRNQVQWRVPELTDAAVRTFHQTRERLRLSPVIAHGSYLMNLAGRSDVRRKSIKALSTDLRRSRRLGIDAFVLHPGTNPDAEEGIRLIADGLNTAAASLPDGPRILLETTAGQGNSIGYTFEQLAALLDRLDAPGRFGACFDTCHVFAAGYDLRTPAAYEATMDAFDRVLGLGRLEAVHLNDSKRPLGSRVDRHEHIGRGKIGRSGLGHLIRDRRLADVPLILETPKGKDDRGRDWDAVNARTVRSLLHPRPKETAR